MNLFITFSQILSQLLTVAICGEILMIFKIRGRVSKALSTTTETTKMPLSLTRGRDILTIRTW